MKKILASVLVFITIFSFGQINQQPNAAEIQLQLNKLNFLGSVLYVAAHPDDENTRIITYMANGRLAETAYLSMTRGDGGQNLIGPEMRDLLGLIRTQELLAARRIDGGSQFFTRANDFGYSRSVDETMKIWSKEEILSDVVRAFRKFKPDVIITRFPPDERAGHGHHTASAVLAQEAFDIAAKANQYPEQVKEFGTWQPKRIYTNTGRWWNTTINENTPGITVVNVGGYSPLLGESFTEIASRSRSQHKSQGFGSRGVRGDELEFLELAKGEASTKDIFDGVNTRWSRVKGGEKVQPLIDKAIADFDPANPAGIIEQLFAIRTAIANLDDSVWKSRKLSDVEDLIRNCLGLYIHVRADNYWIAPGAAIHCNVEIVNRSSANVTVEKVSSTDIQFDSVLNIPLQNNIPINFNVKSQVSSSQSYSDPYWLSNPHGLGIFTVTDKANIGKPENDPALTTSFRINVQGKVIALTVPVQYGWTDRVAGEQIRPVEITPPVFVNLSESVIIFKDNSPKAVQVTVKSAAENIKGEVKLSLPQGWKAEPALHPFEIVGRGEEKVISFTVIPAGGEITGTLKVIAQIGDKKYDKSLQVIQYDHFPIQTLLPTSEAKVVKMDIKRGGEVIGYIRGAGDDIPLALRTMGYQVWEMKDDEVTFENLQRVDAVVLGVRAVNTNERLEFVMPDLFNYVKQGGTLVVQYNTSTAIDKFSPYPLALSRERVTEEDAEVRILKPDHAVLNTPNKITAKDFEGWVQERGLYFPNKWDDHFEAILSMNDTGQPAAEGSLLVAKYGEGHYVYTGLSFFRELPEGVPGAFKLFSNISITD